MKRLITAIFVALCLASCATVHANPLPAGAVACSSDWDCPSGQGCGFPAQPGWNYARCISGVDHRWDVPKVGGN